MNRRLSFAFALTLVLAACSTPDPLYCDEDTPCDDPALPFCDLGGDYPASEGIDHTCIAEPAFAVSLSDDDAQVRIGGTLELDVTIDRTDDFPGDITITAADLPDGATADPLTIPDGATSGTLTIQAPDAEPGALAAATVTATAGPIAAAADLRLLVLGPAGSLDPTFGTLGLAGEPAESSIDDARFLMQLTDGRFIVGGGRSAGVPTAHLVRFSAEGALDTDFGDGGVAEVDFEGTEVDAQGNIYLASQSGDRVVLGMGSASGDIVLVRVTGDAQRDDAFGGTGIIASEVSGGSVQVAGLEVGVSDEIVVGMHVGASDLIYLVRFTKDGERDQAFATDGRLEIDRGDSVPAARTPFFRRAPADVSLMA